MTLSFQSAGKWFAGPDPRRGRGVWAVRDVRVEIGAGVTAVVGPNGAGKTTVLRLAAGLTPPTEGRVTLNAADAAADGARYRDAVGYAPQQSGFYEEMTPLAFLIHMSRLKLIPRSLAAGRCRQLVERAGLAEAAGRRISALSHGQRMRLALAQALLNDPRVLVLDEPADQLDPAARLELFALLRRAGGERVTLLSTHAIDDLPGLADNVLQLEAGRVAFWGPMEGYLAGGEGSDRVRAAYRYWGRLVRAGCHPASDSQTFP